ncbi:hypothetical protein C8F01DRAFT_1307497 [Mycena amicta]|nr:hypothetical protein C8F01DRAFT_1307497 [Mycena amicta]
MKNILFIGGTGYIGGVILSRFLEDQAIDERITLLVRSADKAEKLTSLKAVKKELVVVQGSHNDGPLVEKLVAEADVIVSTADCDDLQAMESILRGTKARFEATGVKPTLIHMSGTGCLGDNAKGAFASTKVYSDLDIPEIEALPATQHHRNVDLAVVAADKAGYVNTYIVIPGVVYGAARGILAENGIQNMINFAWVALFRLSFARGAAGIIGEGKNLVAHVEVNEVSINFKARSRRPGASAIQPHTSWHSCSWSREGYYFVDNGSVPFARLVEVVETRTGPRRPLTQEELDQYMPGALSLQAFFGDNGVTLSSRGRAMGWKPVNGTEHLLESLRDELAQYKA